MLTVDNLKKVLETELVGKEYNWKTYCDVLKIVRLCFENEGISSNVTSDFYSRDNKQEVKVYYKGYNFLKINILKKKGQKHNAFLSSYCDWTVKGFEVSCSLIYLISESSSDLVVALNHISSDLVVVLNHIDELVLKQQEEHENDLEKKVKFIKEIQVAHPELSVDNIKDLFTEIRKNWYEIEKRLSE